MKLDRAVNSPTPPESQVPQHVPDEVWDPFERWLMLADDLLQNWPDVRPGSKGAVAPHS
jgi:hypothetical protein